MCCFFGAQVHEFDDSVVDRTTNFLNDIVVDISEGDGGNKFAFIADASDGVIIVYDFDNDQSWRVDHPSMKVDPNVRSCSRQIYNTKQYSSYNC